MNKAYWEKDTERYREDSNQYRNIPKPEPRILILALCLLCLLVNLIAPLSALAQYNPGNTYLGTNNYIEYHAGNLPIIISAPHGGSLAPPTIADRACSGCVTVKDSWTEELAYKIDSAVQVVFGGYPHIIFNKLSRKKLDANREIVEAALGNPDAEIAWHEYHDFLQAAKDSCVANFGSAIYIDLHAHGHTNQRIELGYLLGKAELQLSNGTLDAMNFQDSCSIRHLNNVLNPSASFANMLRGSDCMGELLTYRGYSSVPSVSDPAPATADPYFSGGYNTVRHGSRDSSQINAIQFETNFTGLRDNNTNRNAFAQALACVLRSFLDQWYFDLDTWDPGHLVTSNADSGPGSLRSALLGAEDGTVITFDAALSGDTIRLQKELQVCANITIQGPGSDLLTISGEDTTRILRIMAGNLVEVSGLSLVRGKTPAREDGGAVLANGSITLSNCILANNYADDDGGAVAVAGSFAIIQLDSCLVIGNSCGDDGGALRCFDGSLILNATTVKDNFSPSYGGGLSSNGTVSITNSTLEQNEATGNGGGIRNFGSGTITCINTTIAGNICGNRGAGISTASSVELNFCTLINNIALSLGGGIRVPTGGICSLRNTLVAGNSGSGGHDISMFAGTIISQGYNLVGDTTGSSWIPATADQLGSTIAPVDPLILPLDSNGGPTQTVALLAGSPCIDQANTTAAPLWDQRGFPRISGPQPDIGSYEFCIPSNGTDIQSACNSYTWLDGISYTSSNNSSTYIFTNAVGCDSVVTLDLTINRVDTSITQTANTLSANATGTTYQWLDCNNALNVLTGETNSTFTPAANGDYAVEITQNGCVDTSACYSMNTVGIFENNFGKDLAVYPNPTSGNITIALGSSYPVINTNIINSIGQLIQRLEFSNTQEVELKITGPTGLYFVEIMTTDNKKAILMILKE